MYIITRLQCHVKIYFSLGIKKPSTQAGFKYGVLIRTSYLVHQLRMRACLREQKSYGLEVLTLHIDTLYSSCLFELSSISLSE